MGAATMSNKPVQPDPEEQHKDLLATLAASRELGPEMDRALAESYLQKHPELVGQKQQAVVAQPEQQRSVSPDVVGLAGMGIGVVAYIAVLWTSKGDLWWMFWPLMGWFGWRWGWGRSGVRDELRQARYQARVERYRARAAGYASYYGNAPQEQMQQPQQPQQQAQPQVSAPAPVQAQPLPPTSAPAPVTPSAPQSTAESRLGDVPPLNPAG
jgi:hypothetical protein